MSDRAEILVDPRVSRAKFDREIAEYRSMEDAYIRQGWWLVKAEFPEVFVVFGTVHQKVPLVAFGALLDFTNYDLWAPSVKIVDPFTRIPYKAQELPTLFVRRLVSQPNGGTPGDTTEATDAPSASVTLQPMMMFHRPDSEPFLCLPGTRAYHEHPSHSGDDWLLHRGRGEGRLYFLLNTLYSYGVKPLILQVQMRLVPHVQRMPE